MTEVREGLTFRRRIRSFVYALEGWWHVIRTQPNAWIHAVISLAVIVLAFWLRLGRMEWAILVLTMALVWMAEFFNTALESAVDMAMPDVHPLAKAAKDVAAAAVLVGAIGAVVVGLLVMGPPLWIRLFG
ncbi:MAG: diacylglycerol kinase family protein [Anaerolineae bacterium]|nr:diacylglycerol kinase family protein [Promineifilum sp.]MCZ2114056.1 diacylglycerol kinase family protein [Anaerolineae bacterium]HNS39976.1 diacylglycerol kinase family protein [Promineifilum sp.]